MEAELSNWMRLDPFEHSKREMKVVSGNEVELKKRLSRRIRFGTAGLRSEMAAGWSCMNDLIIIQTTQGLVKYLESSSPSGLKDRGVIIGVDHRKRGPYSSQRFGELTAAVFLHHGWKVYFFPEAIPTPFVPFGITYYGCACGIVITASHNPKEDNGYKLYWENGCQITSPLNRRIEESILENLEVWKDLDICSESILRKCLDPSEVLDKYFEASMSLQFRTNETAKTKVVYTAMHGVGGIHVKRIIEQFGFPSECLVVTPSQQHPDPDFPTCKKPNPEEDGALDEAKAVAEKNGIKLVIANDPDADRLALAELQRDGKTWVQFNGDEMALLFVDWLVRNLKKKSGKKKMSDYVVINSTVSSKALKGFAEVEGLTYDETLTGFKWIGNKGVEYTKKGFEFLLGYEVEIGFALGSVTYDKDGIRAAAVMCELLDSCYASGCSVSEKLESIYKHIGFYRMLSKYFFADTDEKMKVVYDQLRQGGYPSHCGKFKIRSVRDLTVGYDNSKPGNKPSLPTTPGSQMITFTFEDDSVATLRNSGTEPKVKWYVECKGKTKQLANNKAVELASSMINEFVKPKINGLGLPFEGWKLE